MFRAASGIAVFVLSLFAAAGCASTSPAGPSGDVNLPPGADVSTPFPIDRGDESASTPGTYKGLPLRLVQRAAPAVTAVDGVIGVVCVSMSNGNQECNEYIQRLASGWAGEVNPQVRVVNCAVGGHAIERWIDPAFDATLWDDCVDRKLGLRGVRLDQVRVIWHKAANQFGAGPGGTALPHYPDPSSDYEAFRDHLSAFAARVTTKFPAVQAVYSSTRTYGGFSARADRGEPLSYEEGHALNTWLSEHPSVNGVWYGWGPYLWAPDCSSGVTNGSGVCFDRSDYQNDAVHPTPTGRLKVAQMIHARFLAEPWYKPGGTNQ